MVADVYEYCKSSLATVQVLYKHLGSIWTYCTVLYLQTFCCYEYARYILSLSLSLSEERVPTQRLPVHVQHGRAYTDTGALCLRQTVRDLGLITCTTSSTSTSTWRERT